jgi:hypothetical protein
LSATKPAALAIPTPLFQAQDHAILGIKCPTLAGSAACNIGLATRQYAIADLYNVNFTQFPNGVGIKVAENSKVSVFSPSILGTPASGRLSVTIHS